MNFTGEVDDPGTLKMFTIVDPFVYFDRLASLPKFFINACGDEFLQVRKVRFVAPPTASSQEYQNKYLWLCYAVILTVPTLGVALWVRNTSERTALAAC